MITYVPSLINTIPSTSSDNGIKGQNAISSSDYYVCVDNNNWKKVGLSSF